MLSPGELVYFGAGHTKQPQPNCFGRESIAQILRPVVELYLSRVLPSVSGLQCRPLEELLGMVPLADDFPLDCRSHPLLMSTQNASKHTKHSKHMLQQSSLLRHLDDRGCLDPRYAFVEFGAGKGELSVYVHEVLASKPSTNGPSSIILVDRKNFRQKYTVETASSHRFQRMYIDIRDLDLAKVPELQTTDPGTGAPKLRPVVAYSKHLCGAATDLTIRCLQRYQDAGGSVVGIAIALCCHHRCKYSMYADPAYLSQTLALSAAAGGATSSSGDDSAPDAMWNESRRNVFRQLAAMSSWAINAPHPPQSQAPEKDNGNDSGLHRSGLSFAQRVRAGHAVKRALDLGRLDFVRKGLGMTSAELFYISTLALCATLAASSVNAQNLGDSNDIGSALVITNSNAPAAPSISSSASSASVANTASSAPADAASTTAPAEASPSNNGASPSNVAASPTPVASDNSSANAGSASNGSGNGVTSVAAGNTEPAPSPANGNTASAVASTDAGASVGEESDLGSDASEQSADASDEESSGSDDKESSAESSHEKSSTSGASAIFTSGFSLTALAAVAITSALF
ncbi:tRNA:m4X modification enzyme [Coemansia erecta]|nr:tRNA:m4X modification enzyme [Coemansia erecta]